MTRAAKGRCEILQNTYSGKLEALASQNPDGLATAIKAYEAMQDLMGRLMSYADQIIP